MSPNKEKSAILENLKSHIASYPDFPKKGIIFRDILPILQNPKCFEHMLFLFQDILRENVPDCSGIIGIESRGFLLGPTLALKMELPFIPLRKPGKLPGDVIKEAYSLEYGSDALEIQRNSIEKGKTYAVIDDLLATGGTMSAAVNLIEKLGGSVGACMVAVELKELNGRERIPTKIHSLVQY